jgi:dihydroxy-acid dehydratase
MAKKPLRSAKSYGKHDKDGFIHRSWIKATGLPDHVFDGRPVIGIANTWSELVTCQIGLRDLADYVKRGIWEAGGVPIEFPAMSLPETQMRPTAMLFRNLLAMEVEESIRAGPPDGRRQRRPAGDLRLVGADAERQVPGPRHRLRHRRLALLRSRPRRRDEPR